MSTLNGMKVDYQMEYSVLRKKLTTKGCDFDALSDAAGLLYLNCKDDYWSEMLRILLGEITQREMMTRLYGL